MHFTADLHIHSHYSIATSSKLCPEYLDYWARIKGIQVIGTGDFTHPGWVNELKKKLEPAEEGLFKLKKEYRIEIPSQQYPGDIKSTRFLLTAEISNIYKKKGKVRKVHNIIFSPDFEVVEKIQFKLRQFGFNITSDGRPILGMDSRDLLELALSCSDKIFFVPAHIWTPWFSALGAKSGFESINECYEDLSAYIFAIEMGLSSDPPMNWMCSMLDRFSLMANSDAHSPEKLGRNANLLNTDLSYESIVNAFKSGNPDQFTGTINFFPQEGKYHYAGHKKCNICWDPVETLQNNGLCPVCKTPVTRGVLDRVVELSDRDDVSKRKTRLPYYSLIPLKEILAEINHIGSTSKKITQIYNALIQRGGSELNILLNLSLGDVKMLGNELLTEGIRRMRNREVIVKKGYDGEYGIIRVFTDEELRTQPSQQMLFMAKKMADSPLIKSLGYISFDLAAYRNLKKNNQSTIGTGEIFLEKSEAYNKETTQPKLNSKQTMAVNHLVGPALVLAGPGTGKTNVLVQRISRLVNQHKTGPKSILAVTFTNKAAGEMKERLQGLPGKDYGDEPTVSTFHALGYQIINENLELTGRRKQFSIITEDDKTLLLTHHLGVPAAKGKEISEQIAYIKQQIDDFSLADNYLNDTFHRYNELLMKYNLYDLQDLIYLPVKLLSQHPEILSQYQDRYPWILVDEYQDINYSQYALLKLLTSGLHSNIFVIGDPDQAIYGFRGADVHYIQSFIEDYPDAVIYNLTQSYRCSDHILKASLEIIHKKHHENSDIHGLNEGVKINITENATGKSEAEFVARTIEQMIGGLRFFSIDSKISTGQEDAEIKSLSEFAVLCRVSKQMEAVKKAFHDHSIPYQTVHETAFFRQYPVSTVIDMIKLSFNPDNILLKHKLYNNDKINKLHLADLNQIVNHYPLDEAISHLITQFFKNQSLVSDEKIKNLIFIAKKYSDSPDKFLRFVSLGSGIDTYETNIEKVSLMTIHAAKGLEFKAVFIIGCEEGLIPYSLFKEHRADPEEEKRLLYVGMTRAMRYLWLTFAKKRFIWGKEYHLTRSHFLDQIEEKLIRLSKTTSGKKLTKPNGQLDLFS